MSESLKKKQCIVEQNTLCADLVLTFSHGLLALSTNNVMYAQAGYVKSHRQFDRDRYFVAEAKYERHPSCFQFSAQLVIFVRFVS